MTSKDSRATRQCVYCGSQENLTAEHAPPRAIFLTPRPSDLITVPACEACNRAGSKDAEYFKTCVCLNRDGKASATVQALKPTVFKALNRTEAERFARALLGNLEKAKDGFVLNVDMKRIHAVIEQTVRCLYLHETGERIPQVNEVSVFCNDFLRQFNKEKVIDFHETFVVPLAEQTPKTIGGDTFAYSWIDTGEAFGSIWGLVFYGYMPFVALTGTRQKKVVDVAGA